MADTFTQELVAQGEKMGLIKGEKIGLSKGEKRGIEKEKRIPSSGCLSMVYLMRI